MGCGGRVRGEECRYVAGAGIRFQTEGAFATTARASAESGKRGLGVRLVLEERTEVEGAGARIGDSWPSDSVQP